MKKMKYDSLELEIIKFEAEDIIVTSFDTDDDTSEDAP